MGNPDQVDGVRPPMAVGRSGGEAKEPLLVGESFVAAAAANRSMIMFDDVSCPPDPRRAPRAVLLFTGHLRGTCDSQRVWSTDQRAWSTRRSPKIDVIVNQTRWCRETFGSGCHAFLHTWSTLDKAPTLLNESALARLNLSRPYRGGAPPRSSAASNPITLTATLPPTLTLTRRAHAALLGGVRRGDPRGGGRTPPHRSH